MEHNGGATFLWVVREGLSEEVHFELWPKQS